MPHFLGQLPDEIAAFFYFHFQLHHLYTFQSKVLPEVENPAGSPIALIMTSGSALTMLVQYLLINFLKFQTILEMVSFLLPCSISVNPSKILFT